MIKRTAIIITLIAAIAVTGCSSSKTHQGSSKTATTTPSGRVAESSKMSQTAKFHFGSTLPLSKHVNASVSAPVASQSPVKHAKYLLTFTVGVVNHSAADLDVSKFGFTAVSNGKRLERVDGGGPLKPHVAKGQSIAFRVLFLSDTKTVTRLTVDGGSIGSATFTH